MWCVSCIMRVSCACKIAYKTDFKEEEETSAFVRDLVLCFVHRLKSYRATRVTYSRFWVH